MAETAEVSREASRAIPLLEPALEAALKDPDQRSKLNPLEIAQAVKTLQEEGLSCTQIQRQYNFAEGAVSQYRKLLELPPKVQEHIRQGKLSFSQARSLLMLPREQTVLIEHAADEAVSSGMSTRETEAYVKGFLGHVGELRQEVCQAGQMVSQADQAPRQVSQDTLSSRQEMGHPATSVRQEDHQAEQGDQNTFLTHVESEADAQNKWLTRQKTEQNDPLLASPNPFSPFGKGGFRGICRTVWVKFNNKSPLTPLCQRGGIVPIQHSVLSRLSKSHWG